MASSRRSDATFELARSAGVFAPRARLVARWLVASFLAGCAMETGLHRVPDVPEHEAHCARAAMGQDSPYRMPLADPLTNPKDTAWLGPLPPEARRTARAAGLEPLLAALMHVLAADRARVAGITAIDDEQLAAWNRIPAPPPLTYTVDPDALIERAATLGPKTLILYQELTLRLVAFQVQLDALAFETQCTRQRVAELVRDLDEEENDRLWSLAMSSLITGATTGIAASAIELSGISSRLPLNIALIGGVMTAAIGTAALLVPERDMWLEHPRNLLRPIVRGEDPEHLYPSFVFRMLTVRYAGDVTTPRDQMQADFSLILKAYADDSQRSRIENILFGDGGRYPRDLLEARVELLHVLESAVHGVARDVELFDRFLVKLLAPPR